MWCLQVCVIAMKLIIMFQGTTQLTVSSTCHARNRTVCTRHVQPEGESGLGFQTRAGDIYSCVEYRTAEDEENNLSVSQLHVDIACFFTVYFPYSTKFSWTNK